jgi:hypothetical protein
MPKRWHAWFRSLWTLSALIIVILASPSSWAGDGPFMITYTHQMEEKGDMEIATMGVTGNPSNGNRFLGVATELEYGLTDRWVTSLYLDGQATDSRSATFTGYKWENRFRLLSRERWINPVVYVEFQNINGADKTLLDVVNHDSNDDLIQPNGDGHHEKKREIETKLILGSHFKGWTIAENLIAEKNIKHQPFEFGYAVGFGRPLAVAAGPDRCNFCAENVQLGVEMYGGLGTHDDFGLRRTSQYVAPTVAWTFANGTTFRVSPGFGVTDASASLLLRFGLSYDIDEFGRAVRSLFHSNGGRP